MSDRRTLRRWNLAALTAAIVGIIGCGIGAAIDAPGFFRAWLCAYLFWLGVPLCGITLVMVHDLTGGNWMRAARPALAAATATMPLATLAGIPAFIGLHALYSWTHPAPGLGNIFYLNPTGFYLRYAADVVLWNLLAAFALWGPRTEATPIPPGLSWLSGIGLILLAVSAGFASIDWIMSVEPDFWSSIFPMAIGAGWFNTGLALVLLSVALLVDAAAERGYMADLAAILLATTIFWAYAEFMQFLIIWEENLKSEIPWYLPRIDGLWQVVEYVAATLAFFVPFFVLVTKPGKHSRTAVVVVCIGILLGRVAEKWWLVLPQYANAGPFWLDAAAMLALGGMILLLFLLALRFAAALIAPAVRLASSHG